jgi:4-amino-4-deoxy-L-arabinose transferase-like glycosyltransferase
MVLVAIASLPTLRFVWHRAGSVRGWEADSIAKAIVQGHGFSFAGNERWLWEKWNGDPNTYFPTAWVDPVFTYLLAGTHWIFGHYVYIAMYACSFLCIGVIYFCSYRTASRFGGPWVGALAVVLIAANVGLGKAFFDDITNSALSAAAISATALFSIRYLEQPDLRRLTVMGLAMGFTVLTCPAAVYFPLMMVGALAMFHARDFKTTLKHSALMFVCAAVVIAPWTIRNYLTFDEFVLVRNGAGQIAWDGTVGPASTFMPGTAKSPVPPPWRSSGPEEAVENMLDKDKRLPVHRYQVISLTAAPVPGYHEMNEAERDALSMNRTIEFIWRHPLVAAEMGWIKLWVYFTRFGNYGLLILIAAATTAVARLRDSRTWPLTLLAVSYSMPFVLVIAYFGRYRAPIEAVLSVLAAIGIGALATSPWGLRLRDAIKARLALPQQPIPIYSDERDRRWRSR